MPLARTATIFLDPTDYPGVYNTNRNQGVKCAISKQYCDFPVVIVRYKGQGVFTSFYEENELKRYFKTHGYVDPETSEKVLPDQVQAVSFDGKHVHGTEAMIKSKLPPHKSLLLDHGNAGPRAHPTTQGVASLRSLQPHNPDEMRAARGDFKDLPRFRNKGPLQPLLLTQHPPANHWNDEQSSARRQPRDHGDAAHGVASFMSLQPRKPVKFGLLQPPANHWNDEQSSAWRQPHAQPQPATVHWAAIGNQGQLHKIAGVWVDNRGQPVETMMV